MPYSNRPNWAFWKLCVEDRKHLLGDLYRPKFQISASSRIATAGSCFAQHFGRYVRNSNLVFLDAEPAPKLMPEAVAFDYGYGIFSARYGNIYTVCQLRQLVEDCLNLKLREAAIWQDGRVVIDGLRPTIEKKGYRSQDELRRHRLHHLRKVFELLSGCDVFVFTLGLTEAWRDRRDGTVFPVAPGTAAGKFDTDNHEFVNFDVFDVVEDLNFVVRSLREMNPSIKVLLTVSPVPLTATATDNHVIQATTYSKAVLRAAAGHCVERYSNVDYFPSYEIITSPVFHRRFFEANLRSVTLRGVEMVMQVFFGAHEELNPRRREKVSVGRSKKVTQANERLICEEVALEEFIKK